MTIPLRLFLVPVIICGLFASALPAHAQLSLTGLERQLTLKLSPEYPAAGETVALSITTYALDLDRSTVTWYANGKVIAKGAGLTSTSIQAGTLGSGTSIDVVAEEDAAGLIGSAHADIRPTEVDLLWKSESYVPPFYKGKTLAGSGATISAQALVRFKRPDGSFVAEKDIVYTWYRDTARIASGKGRSSTVFAGPALFSGNRISVLAESADGTYKGRAETYIASADPTLELYEDHPLFGILYHRALIGDVTTIEKEQKIAAVPYFVLARSPKAADLAYEWSVNGKEILPDPKNPDILTITTEGYVGPADVSLTLTSTSDWFLRATGSWRLLFSDSSVGLFNDPFARSTQ